jgi:Mg-chelatase subunit ChlD
MFNDEEEEKPKFQDWFGRAAEDGYTFRNDTNKVVDWETKHHNYSDFLLGSTNTPQEAARLLNSMFNMMGVHKKEKVTASLSSAANGAGILLPVDLLNDDLHKETPRGERSDAFLGGAIRNGAISAFEKTRVASAIQSARYEAAKGEGVTPAQRIKATFETILHDERTDRKVAEKFPGYSRFISKYKQYKFDKCYEPKTEFKNDAEQFMDLLMRMIQYPGTVTQEEVEKFEPHIEATRDMMNHYGGIPEGFTETQMLSDRMATYIINMLPPPEEEPPGGGGGGGEGEGEGEGGGGGTPPPAGSSLEEMMESLGEAAKSMAETMLSEEESHSSESSEIMKNMESEMEEGGRVTSDEGTSNGKVYWTKAKDEKPAYLSSLDRIDRAKANTVANLLKRKSRDFKFSIKGMRSGRLDTNKLVEARQHVPTVYERMGEVKTDKLAVCILIDESGSMGGSKIDKAKQAAIFLNEAFGKQPDVELFIYGHTADHNQSSGGTEMMVYREPGHKFRYSLGNVAARSNNRDGHAIIETAKRVRTFTQNPVVMIVISDGQPAASGYGGYIGMEHTRKMVLKAEGLGMQVIQVAIDSVASEKMFKNFVVMKNMSTFPNDLVNFLKVRVNKNIKEHVTIA